MPHASSSLSILLPTLALLLPSLSAQASLRAASVTVYGPLLDPVSDAEITIYRSDWSVLARGRTDGSGLYCFATAESGFVYCSATAPGLTIACYHAMPQPQGKPPGHVDLRLFPAAKVRGTVRDDTGKPVAGAEVIGVLDFAPLTLINARPEQVQSDADGRFSLSHVPLGEVALRASADGHELGETRTYLRGDAELDVAMPRGAGRQLVVALEGVPTERLADVVCEWSVWRSVPQPKMPALSGMPAMMQLPRRLMQGTFDARGRCVVRGLPRQPQLSMIRLDADGMRFLPQWREVEAGADGNVTFQLEQITGPRPSPVQPEAAPEPAAPLVPTAVGKPTLRGVLRDEHGAPKPRMRVRLYSDRTGWRQAVTAEDGGFAVDAAYQPGDKIALELGDADWVLIDDQPGGWTPGGEIWRTYRAGEVEQLVLTPAARIHGKVKARGQRTGGLSVVLEVEEAQAHGRRFAGFGLTDADGAFTIAGLRGHPGEHWLVVSGIEGTAEAGPFHMPDERVLDGVVIELQPPLSVTGTVLDRAGKPLPGARVLLAEWRGSADMLFGGDDVQTDIDGRFAFRGMKPGRYAVQVRVTGTEPAATTKPFEVGPKPSIDCPIRLTDG